MTAQQKRDLARQEQTVRQRGKPYYPYIFVRDVLAALVLLLILIALSAWVGIESQPPANPADSSYIPHPEWFFLFFYEIVKYFPGNLSTIAVVGLPSLVFGGLMFLPWLDRSANRHPRQRAGVMALMTFGWVIVLGFSALAFISAPPALESSQAIPGVNVSNTSEKPGQSLYKDNCASCHGEFGEGGPNPSQRGAVIPPISSKDFLATYSDDTLFKITANGLTDRGMAAFSQSNGGPLDDRKIEQLVSYIRSWEASPPVVAAYIPPTAVPINGEALFTSVCAACHGLYGEGGVGPKLTTIDFSKIFSIPIQAMHPKAMAKADALSQHVWDRLNTLSGAELEAVLNYTYSLSSSGAAPVASAPSAAQGDAANGSALYKSWCANCHGSDGKTGVGKDKVVIVDPSYLASKDDAQLVEIINKGFPKPDDMPAYKDILSSQEVSDLLAMLRSGQP